MLVQSLREGEGGSKFFSAWIVFYERMKEIKRAMEGLAIVLI